MKETAKDYEPHVTTSRFLDYRGEYTPNPSESRQLPEDRRRVVDLVIAMYNGKIEQHWEEFEACYSKDSIYDDIMSFADTRCVGERHQYSAGYCTCLTVFFFFRTLCRRKIAAQFYALPRCFSKVEVLEYEVAFNEGNLTCLKLKTAYTEPILGTKEIKHLVSLNYDHTSPVRYITRFLKPA